MTTRAPELVVERDAVDRLPVTLGAGGLTVSGEAGHPSPLRRTWVDTFDWRLHRAGLELEQVESKGAVSFELRGLGDRDVGVAGGNPVEWPAEADALPAGAVRDRVAAVAGIRALVVTACFDGHRRTLPILDDNDKTVARLHVDVPTDDGVPARMTVSPLRGYDREAGRASALLAELAGVTRAPTSCYEDRRAASGRDVDELARPVVTAEMPASTAIAGVLGMFLATAEANVPGVLADVDTEFLHDLRVAVRRARSTVKLAGDVLGAGAPDGTPVTQLASELKWLGDATTPTRDLDVYLLGVPKMAARLRAARDDDLDEFRIHVAGRRAAAFDRLSDDLRSPRFGRLLAAWRAVSAEGSVAVPSGPTAAEYGAARLQRAHRRVVKLGRAITADSPPTQLHDLRKRCKELRYLLEIFAPIEPPRSRKQVLPVLKALQECLGEFQDSEVQADAIRTFAGEMMPSARPATLLAMGELAAHLDADQEHARAEFAGIFATFTAATRQLRWTDESRSG
jgi:CHAD domain-containing protein